MQPKIVAAASGRVECELHANHPLRVIGAAGRRIHCVSGVAWVTAYNHHHDIFLKPGQVYEIPNDGLLLAEAVGHCRVLVDLPRAFDYRPRRVRGRALLGWLRRGLQAALSRKPV
jgi:hypothetical protein